MEPSTPMVIFSVMKFFYFLPGLMCNSMPMLYNQYPLYSSSVVNVGQITKENENNWFELISTQK